MLSPETGRSDLSGQLVHRIRGAIASGSLLPGSRLPAERSWASELGVSRATLRAAVKELAGMGLLEVRRSSGIFVAAPQDAEATLQRVADALILQRGPLADLFEVRIVLEAMAAQWAAERAVQRDVKRLQAAYAAMRSSFEKGHLAIGQANAMDRRIHRLIAAISGNAVIPSVVENLRTLQERSRSLDRVLTPGRIAVNVADLGAIVSCIARHDGPGAHAAMASHLRRGEMDNREHPKSG